MQTDLIRHPGAPSPVRSIAVAAVRSEHGDLLLHYRVVGRCLVPPPGLPHRADGLWRHSCFEAFVRGGGCGYREFNFSPSRAWAAYRFDGYRRGMRRLIASPPGIMARRDESGLNLYVRLGRDALPKGEWHLGLTAVIESKDGTLSYWALRHPAGAADFHRADCFGMRLDPPSAT